MKGILIVVNKPKISVLMPVYNVEKYIEEALCSLINQTLKDIEVICINDCSTDSSLDIIKKYSEKNDRIKYIKQSTNKGEIVAKYTGLQMAQAEYIGTLDPDDYLVPECYETMYNKAIEGDFDVVISNILCVRENGRIKKGKIISPYQSSNHLSDVDSFEILKYANQGTTNKIIKKDLLLNAFNFKERDIWKDTYQFWRCYTSKACHGCLIDKNFYYYRQRRSSITHYCQDSKDRYNSFIKTIYLIIKYLSENSIYGLYKDTLVDYIYKSIAIHRCIEKYFRQQDLDKITNNFGLEGVEIPFKKETYSKFFSLKQLKNINKRVK